MTTTTQKAEQKALEYRGRAEAATAAAVACDLDHRRLLHENAAATWTKMAEMEERRVLEARKAADIAAARLALAPAFTAAPALDAAT